MAQSPGENYNIYCHTNKRKKWKTNGVWAFEMNMQFVLTVIVWHNPKNSIKAVKRRNSCFIVIWCWSDVRVRAYERDCCVVLCLVSSFRFFLLYFRQFVPRFVFMCVLLWAKVAEYAISKYVRVIFTNLRWSLRCKWNHSICKSTTTKK